MVTPAGVGALAGVAGVAGRVLERGCPAAVKQEGVLGLLLHAWLCQAEDIILLMSWFWTGSSQQNPQYGGEGACCLCLSLLTLPPTHVFRPAGEGAGPAAAGDKEPGYSREGRPHHGDHHYAEHPVGRWLGTQYCHQD